MDVASGCGEQEVGVASGSGWNHTQYKYNTGCGFKEIYRFPHSTYPYSSCICSFLQQHPYFLFIFKNVFLYIIYIGRILHSSTVSVGSLRLAQITLYGNTV